MNKQTILWADDDPDDIMIMREALQGSEQNFNITEVSNGREALDHLERARRTRSLPCLIILDMNMPVLNGRETVIALKNNKDFQNIPVVVFTTSNSEMDKLFCKRYGVEMFTKPPDFSGFRQVVFKLLGYCRFSEVA